MINNDDIEKKMKDMKYSINISLMIDSLYNMIIYKKCEIELSFE